MALPPPGLLSGLLTSMLILGHLFSDAHHYRCLDNGVHERNDLVGLKLKKLEAMEK